MEQVNYFVLLDDVEFSRQSWQQRNHIKTPKGSVWLTVPVYRKGRSKQLINEVVINPQTNWERKHYKTLKQHYGSAEYWCDNETWLAATYDRTWNKLCTLNRAFIEKIIAILDVNTEIHLASQMDISGGRVDRLACICRQLGADEYLSPMGSFEYIMANNCFLDVGVTLLFQHYAHPIYQQLYGDFYSHLSVVDLILNRGPHSLEIIQSGQRSPYTVDEALRQREVDRK